MLIKITSTTSTTLTKCLSLLVNFNWIVELLRVRNVKNFFLLTSIQFSSVVFLILSLRRNEGTLKKMEVNMYRESTFKNQQKCQLDFLIFILMAITATFLSFLLMKVFPSLLWIWCVMPWKGRVNEKGVSSNIEKSNYWDLNQKSY